VCPWAGVWALEMALHPRCLNLRNMTWHGFLAPSDVQPELAALAAGAYTRSR